MRKLFYLFIMALFCTLWSCSKGGSHIDEPDDPDNPDNPTDVTLEISTTDLVFEAKGGEREFTVYCNADWTVTNESDWCTTNVTEGNGYGRVAVTVEAYSDTEDRNTNLTVKAGDKTEVLTVTQKHGDAIILSKDKFDVPQEGGEIAIEVKSNIEYQVSIPSKFQSWIKQTPESRAVTVKNFSFTVSANEAYEKREGYIVFRGNSLKDTVYVYQAQKNQLILTEDTYNIPSEGQDITIELKTNVDYEVTIQPNDAASWISQISARAIRTDKLNFHIEANTESNNRSAKIVIKDKNSDLSDTVQVNQAVKGMYAGDIIFETEQDLIDFHAAGHTKIMGNIIVKGYKIKTLQKLGNLLTEINGSLRLECSTLTSLDGLYGLKTITDSLIITKGSMTSFEGLQNLETIGGSLKIALSALKSFQELSSLKSIGGDFEVNASSSLTALESFEGLENLQTIGGSLKVIASSSSSHYYSYSSSLTALKSFQGLSSLKSIGGDFEVNASSYYSSESLTALVSFKGLENLQTIKGKLTINYCRLISIDALKNVESIKEISIINCPELYDFCVLKNIVQNMSGTFYVNGNGYNPTKYQLLNGECSKQPE